MLAESHAVLSDLTILPEFMDGFVWPSPSSARNYNDPARGDLWLPLTLSKWRVIWAECERAVESKGMEASSWGHAFTWTDLSHEYELNAETAATILQLFIGDAEAASPEAGPREWHG